MAQYGEMVASMRRVFVTGKTKSLEWRQQQLAAMLRMLDDNRERFCDVLKADLNKAKFEALVMEVDLCRNDLVNCMNNLTEWTKPDKVKKGLMHMMDRVYIRKVPYGVSLIIGAWNYPIQLTILPMIGAIAAGNCVVLKPSEVSDATATLLGELIPEYFDNDCIQCVNGGVPETTALLKERWDFIFYTGNSMVGKIIYKAAAEHLTPVILELGGKSPVFVDENVDLACVANRILWGKTTNSGQTCIAPDYVMCTKETQDELVRKMKDTLTQFYPDGPLKSPDYCRLVSDRHFQRVKKLLGEAGKIALGGETDEAQKYIAPTVISDVQFTDPIMQEEIFGPVLPIVPVKDVDEAIAHINEGEKPLVVYIFTNASKFKEKIQTSVLSGSVVVNDTLIHASIPSLPFGGVGNSGIGAYHGKFTFDAFSHKRGCLERELKMESVNNIRYPPFTENKKKFVDFMMRKKLKKTGVMSLLPYLLFGTLFAVLLKMLCSSDSKWCFFR